MKKILATLVAVAGMCGSVLAQQGAGPANIAGTLYASNFSGWNVPQGNNGPLSWSYQSACNSATSGGATFKPFVVGSPIRIVDNQASLSETVTVTSVRPAGSGCQITVNPSNFHQEFYLTSATAGLQEAINFANGQPYVVIVTPDFIRLGGTTSTITSAIGNANVTILDQRSSIFIPYTWSGTAYIATSFTGGVASVNAGSSSSPGVSVSVTNPTTTPAISVATAPFVASGTGHQQGVVPDPGAIAGITHFLREDSTWAIPPPQTGGVQLTPTTTQTVTQPAGTTLAVNSLNSVLYVNPTSPTDLVTQVNALFASCSYDCEVHIPAGIYSVTSGTINMNYPTESLTGDGPNKVAITYAGTNFLDRRYASAQYSFVTSSVVSGFQLTCSNSAVKCLSGGSTINSVWRDIVVTGPGGPTNSTSSGTSECFNFQNTYNWMERWKIQNVTCGGFSKNLHFMAPTGSGTSSYAYGLVSGMWTNQGAGTEGVVVDAGAQVYNTLGFNYQVNSGGTTTADEYFHIAGIFSGEGFWVTAENAGAPYTFAHIVGTGGQMIWHGDYNAFGSPIITIDTPQTTDGPVPFQLLTTAGSLGRTAGIPTLSNYDGSGENFTVSPIDIFTVSSDQFAGRIGYLTSTTSNKSSIYLAYNAATKLCTFTRNPFGTEASLTSTWCVDGSGNTTQNGGFTANGASTINTANNAVNALTLTGISTNGTHQAFNNTTKNWLVGVQGSSQTNAGYFYFNDVTDGTVPLAFASNGIVLPYLTASTSPLCYFGGIVTNSGCVGGSGVSTITESTAATGAINFTGGGVSQSGNTFTFTGGGGGTGSQYSPAYFSAANTVGGITPGAGIPLFSASAAPTLLSVVGVGTGGICQAPTTAVTAGHVAVFDSSGKCVSDGGNAPAAPFTSPGQIYVANSSLVPTPTAISGAFTLSSGGVATPSVDSTTVAFNSGKFRAAALSTFDPDVMASVVTTSLCAFNGSFTGAASGTTLTVSSVTGTLFPGATITGTGISGTVTILYQLTSTTGSVGAGGTYLTSASTTASGTITFTLQDSETSGFACAFHAAIAYYNSSSFSGAVVRAHSSAYNLPYPIQLPNRAYNSNSIAVQGEPGCSITATAAMGIPMISVINSSGSSAPALLNCYMNANYLASGAWDFSGTFNSRVENVSFGGIDYKGGLGNSNHAFNCAGCGNQVWRNVSGNTGAGYAGFTGTPAEIAVNLTTTAVTSYSITSNVITVVTNNTLSAGQKVQLQGFGTSTFLNGQNLTTSTVSSTQFTAPFTYSNVATTTESGNAVGGAITGYTIGQKAYAINISGGTGGVIGTYNWTSSAGSGSCAASPNGTGTYPSGTLTVTSTGGTYSSGLVTNKGEWCSGGALTITVAGSPGVTGAALTLSFDSGMRGIGISLDPYGNASVPHIYYYGGGFGKQLNPCQTNPTQYQNTNSGGANYSQQLAYQQVVEPSFTLDGNGNPTAITYSGTHNEVDCTPPMYAFINTGSTLYSLANYFAADGGGDDWWMSGGAIVCVNLVGGNPQMHRIHDQCPVGDNWASGVGLDFDHEIDSDSVAGIQVSSSTVKIDHAWYGYNSTYPGAIGIASGTTNSTQNTQINNAQCSGVPGDVSDFLPFVNANGAFNLVSPIIYPGSTIRDWAHCSNEPGLAQEKLNEQATVRTADGTQQALTLTTTGSSGPATLTATPGSATATLNIPQYSGGSSGSTQTAGTAGVAANTFVQVDTSSPSKWVTSGLLYSSYGNCQGASTTAAASGSTFTLLTGGQPVQIYADGAITAGDFVQVSNSTAGYANDTGINANAAYGGVNAGAINTIYCGIALTAATASGQLITVLPTGTVNRGAGVNNLSGTGITGLTGNLYLTAGTPSVGGVQTIASATTVAPTNPLQQVVFTGTTSIATVTPPSGFTAGCFDEYNSGAIATTTAGNINAVYSLTAGSQHRWCYGMVASKWTVQ